MSEHPHTNRLVNEKSPYLLQHAHNPVDWYPWGQEAFTTSLKQDKPIFLSIGYATCHWCHVMERESFENEEIAHMMNDTFINIKVDREELPEVDALYMEFAQSMMSGAAGWPLNLVLTPDLKPFFAATYLPAESGQGMMGMMNLIKRIKDVWYGDERERVLEQASKIVDVFADSVHISGDQLPEKHQIGLTAEMFFKLADPVYGGMKGAPKFPIGYQANFLLTYAIKSRESRALFLTERTLDMMHRGGIFDHLGGGFARYSVDEKWLVPHFEKMLYDNALLADAYVQLASVTQNSRYQEAAEEVLNYILREMTHAEGGFYSAEDADSEGQEGLFYTWTLEEVENILGPSDSQMFCQYYDVTQAGNFEGRNVLHKRHSLEDFATSRGFDVKILEQKFTEQRKILWQVREQRVHPLKDDKILSSWNGLMIHSLVQAGSSFANDIYLKAAERAARFLKKYLWKDGKLLRRWREGEALHNAGLDEYAFLIRGLLSLFEAGRGTEWLEWSVEMTKLLQRSFKARDGAFFQTDGGDDSLILRKVQYSDGAEPSGNAVHCENLLRLYHMTHDSVYLEQAQDILRAVRRYIDSYAPGYVYHVINMLRYYDKQTPLFVVALGKEGQWKQEILQLLTHRYIPFKSIIFRNSDDDALIKQLPLLESQIAVDGKTTLYICYHGVCKEPINDLAGMVQAVSSI
ncbi:MAG: thioredoxin domain-containing protein [Nitrosomonas sp.]|nr:MAG: thioredoxin domain-containing protein [Nitrosomonas sp.]